MPTDYDDTIQKSFTPYPQSILPKGFRYPENYLAHARSMDYPVTFVWEFVDNDLEDGPLEWEFRLTDKNDGWEALADIDPIPFARDGEFAAFFDGNDRTGDPKVVVINLGTKAYGRNYANFDAWLDQAFKDSKMK